MSKEITASDLGQRTRQIAEYYFAHPEKTREEIAKDLGIHKSRVSQVLHHPKVRAYYRVLAKQDVSDNMLPLAAKRYKKIIGKSENDAVAEKAAARVLASEKIFDTTQEITIKNDITIKSIQELRQIIDTTAQAMPLDVVEGQTVETDAIQGTTQDE